MKKEKLGALVFWASLLVLAVCAFLLAGRPTLIPAGIPGDAVAFGMGAEEVAQTAGPPDGTRSENGVRTGFFLYYYQREVLGCPATVSYTFHGRQESPRARVAEAAVDMEFAAQVECDQMLEALCAHFRELMEGEPRFDEYGSEGPVRAWDPPELLRSRSITSARRSVFISQFPCRIFLEVRGNG